jgi:hypothetical protein
MKSDKSKKQKAAAAAIEKRSTRVAAGLAVLLLAVVIGAFAYARQAASQPENVLRQALARSLQSKSGEIALTMSNGVTGEQPSVLQARGPLTSDGVFDLTGTYKRAGKGINLAVRSADGRDAYLKLDNVSQFTDVFGKEAAEYGVSADNNRLKRVENTWLTVPANLKDTVIFNQPVDGRTSPVLSSEDKRQLSELYRQHAFLKVEKVFDEELVAGKLSHHYALDVDSSELREYLTAVQDTIKTVTLRDKQIDNMVATAEHARALEVWICKDDRRLARLIYNGVDGDRTRNVELSVENYDRPVTVNKPDRSLPLLDALAGLGQGSAPASE